MSGPDETPPDFPIGEENRLAPSGIAPTIRPLPEKLPPGQYVWPFRVWVDMVVPRIREFLAVARPFLANGDDPLDPRFGPLHRDLPVFAVFSLRQAVADVDEINASMGGILHYSATSRDLHRTAGRAIWERQWRSLTERWGLARVTITGGEGETYSKVVMPESLDEFPGAHCILPREYELIVACLAMVELPPKPGTNDGWEDDPPASPAGGDGAGTIRIHREPETNASEMIDQAEAMAKFPDARTMADLDEEPRWLIEYMQDGYARGARFKEIELKVAYGRRFNEIASKGGDPRNMLMRLKKSDWRWDLYISFPGGRRGDGYGVIAGRKH